MKLLKNILINSTKCLFVNNGEIFEIRTLNITRLLSQNGSYGTHNFQICYTHTQTYTNRHKHTHTHTHTHKHTQTHTQTYKDYNIKFQVDNSCGVSLCDNLYDNSSRKVHLMMMEFSYPYFRKKNPIYCLEITEMPVVK